MRCPLFGYVLQGVSPVGVWPFEALTSVRVRVLGQHADPDLHWVLGQDQVISLSARPPTLLFPKLAKCSQGQRALVGHAKATRSTGPGLEIFFFLRRFPLLAFVLPPCFPLRSRRRLKYEAAAVRGRQSLVRPLFPFCHPITSFRSRGA